QYLLGWARVKSGDTKTGLADLRAFVAAAPHHELAPAARRTITETLTRSGDPSELQGTYKMLMEQTPPTPEALYDAGSVAGRPARGWRRGTPRTSLPPRRRTSRPQPTPRRRRGATGPAPPPRRPRPCRPAAGGPEQERWQAVRRRGVGAIVLGALLAALPARAATLLPLVPPPPDLTALIPFAEAPLDKPPIGVVDLALPEGPTDLPSFPPATVVAPWGDKPTAAVAHPGKLACVGAFFGVASMALECGRERYTKAEYEDAAKALEQAVRGGSEKDLVLEARCSRAPSASGSVKASGAWASTTAPRRSSSGSSRGAPTRCWTPAGSGSAGGASPRGAPSRARTRSARISHRPRPRRRPGPARSAT